MAVREQWNSSGIASARTRALRPFFAMEVMERALAIDRAGHAVAHMEVGEPDLPAPPEAVEACRRALTQGETRYTDSRGLLELREVIAAQAQTRTGVEVDPDRIVVTQGTSPAMLLIFGLLLEPGDEVILPEPHYPAYPNLVRFFGGVPVPVSTHPGDRWKIDPDAVRRAMTPRTRALVLSSPANPTGAVQDPDNARALAELGIPIISDEIYDGIVYDGCAPTPGLALDPDAFVIDGISKRYAMTGFRLGWAIVPDGARRGLQTMLQNFFISSNGFVQRAGITVLRDCAERVPEMCEIFRPRRDRLVEGLRDLGLGVSHAPAGAFYVLADARRFGSDSLELAMTLLERAHVGVAPGIDFGDAAEGMLRFCFAVSDDTIEMALGRLGDILPELERAQAKRAGSTEP